MLELLVILSLSMSCYWIIVYRLQLPYRYTMFTKDVMLIFLPFYAWVSLIGYFLPIPRLKFYLHFSSISHTWYVCHTGFAHPKTLGEDKLWGSLLCSFPHPPITSSHTRPNVLLSNMFSNILNIRGVIKNYSECCCCWVRSNRKAGIFNMGSSALNLSNSVWQVSTCSVQSVGCELRLREGVFWSVP